MKNILKEILSIPTYFEHEQMLKDYIINFAKKNNINYKIDKKGNIYLIKGVLNGVEKYPCLVAHIDSVYKNQINLIKRGKLLNIIEYKEDDKTILKADNITVGSFSEKTGIGGDDKCGVFICLELLKKSDKLMCAFFVEEEYGCLGSSNSDKNVLKDVGYFIQFDAPSDNWVSETCCGIKLYNDDNIKKISLILEQNGVNNFSKDPYTDVMALRSLYDVNCFNFFAGYYNQHSENEYVVLEHVEKAVVLGYDILNIFKYSLLKKNRNKIIL